MLVSNDAGPVPQLPRMGPGLVLRVLSKRARPLPAGTPAPLTSVFTLPGLDQAHVASYCRALGFTPGAVPLPYWYLPVQRAHMATLLSDDFPYRLAGIVHVENELTAHAQAPLDAPVMLATRIDVLPPTASGAVYCALETVGSANGEPIFTCTSSYLAVRGARSGKARGERLRVQQGAVIDSWTLGPSSGRDYARISGDWNPIHLAPWSARLMGLPAPIIHGMHSLGKACAALEKMAGRPVASISVRFTAPVPLGQAAVLTHGAEANRYVLFCAGVPAADGVFTLG
ncbi:MaoC/PaaZ C-terminal domain-containing protein [Massilia sp. CMS3.1]|uniref:MaoC/PaaZ C-terminal domain-containing protein n=1 Tax=Massilia sp. CMS3.1 TaxID=3373083 RepID=UPI003EE4B676